MAANDQHQAVYEDLAEHYTKKGEAQSRDIFLILAADAAHQVGRADQAERLRGRLLQFSPHNLLLPYASFADAMHSPDIQDYLHDLRRQYPPDQALTLMRTLRGSGYQPRPVAAAPVFRFQPEPTNQARTPTPPRAAATASPYDAFAPLPPGPGNEGDGGAWVATLLFGLGLILALTLAGWVVARPFFTW